MLSKRKKILISILILFQRHRNVLRFNQTVASIYHDDTPKTGFHIFNKEEEELQSKVSLYLFKILIVRKFRYSFYHIDVIFIFTDICFIVTLMNIRCLELYIDYCVVPLPVECRQYLPGMSSSILLKAWQK